jgi:hypothetical protein
MIPDLSLIVNAAGSDIFPNKYQSNLGNLQLSKKSTEIFYLPLPLSAFEIRLGKTIELYSGLNLF